MNTIISERMTIDAETHPVATRRYTIVTPMVEDLTSAIACLVKNGGTGAIIYGEPRRGKTKARRFIAGALQAYFPRLPVFSLIARLYTYPSERVFFGDMLRAFRHAMHAEGTAAQRRDRLLEAAVSAAQSSGQSRVVLCIDQAHCLLEMHFHWLVDFYDELSERGIELFVFFFGQPELLAMYDELQRAGKTQVTGRFMVDKIRYNGIRSVKELKACLKVYDEQAFFPEGSKWTYSRFYFPSAFDGGWRMADHAAVFWTAFSEVRRRGAVAGPMEVPMQHFSRTVERFLMEHQSMEGLPTVTAESIAEIVASTMFAIGGSEPRSGGDEEEEGAE